MTISKAELPGGLMLVIHNANWDGKARFAFMDARWEMSGEVAKALLDLLKAHNVPMEIDAPHPKLYERRMDADHWYATDVDGKGWRWPRTADGWAAREPYPIGPDNWELCWALRACARESGYPGAV